MMRMSKEMKRAYYNVFPKVILTGESREITITPRGEQALFLEEKYTIRFLPMEQSLEPHEGTNHDAYESIDVVPNAKHELVFSFTAKMEQAYIMRIFPSDDYSKQLELMIYAVNEDLYKLRPYICDFHMHTTGSDGAEGFSLMPALYRKDGYDIITITDHERMFPSVDAINFYKDYPIDLTIFKGEEVHLPYNDMIHTVNVGGDISVNTYARENEEEHLKEVNEIMANETMPEGVDALTYAVTLWTLRKIRKVNGLAIFCHPHWICNVYNSPEDLTMALFKHKDTFDAVEVLGDPRATVSQTNLYYHMAMEGYKKPVIGSSDCHGFFFHPNTYKNKTLVFAENKEFENIRDAIKSGNSVAVYEKDGEQAQVYGDYRLIKYGIFLTEEYFPLHKELCYEEGRAMMDIVAGDVEEGRKTLEFLQGRTERFMEKCFR